MLKVTIEFDCSGCEAKETGSAEIHHRFRGISGRDYGFGSWEYSSAATLVGEATPDGWVPFDPYTNVTYCPKCWDDIESGGEG